MSDPQMPEPQNPEEPLEQPDETPPLSDPGEEKPGGGENPLEGDVVPVPPEP